MSEDAAKPKGTQRTQEYIGQRALRALIGTYSKRIQEESGCLLFYLQGRGGLGKTRFLQDYVTLADVAATPIRVCQVIDLVNPEQRKLVVLEQNLIAGLKSGISEQGLPAEEVDAAFLRYFESRDVFLRNLQYDEQRRIAAEETRIGTFVAGWNTLSVRHPLVMRFDTLERLFIRDVPSDALPKRPEARSGVEIILNWLLQVLPKLRHTLVLLSGRPFGAAMENPTREAQFAANPLAQKLHEHGLLDSEDFQILEPLLDPGDIVLYLQSYGIATEGQIAYIQQITEGWPLLLSLYAEYRNPDPPILFNVSLADVSSRPQFQQRLIETILDPLRYMVPEDQQIDADVRERAHEKLVLTFCLYILNYARHGLSVGELSSVLHAIDPQFDLTPKLLKELKDEVLIKTLPQWHANGHTPEQLFLHDEIWQLIDESGRSRDLGLERLVLDKLSAISQDRVVEILQVDDKLGLLRAMTSHVSYALTRDFGQGYRFYLVYMDHMLGQRNDEDALVLANEFWRLLTLTVQRQNGPVRIYHDLLAESRTLDYATVERHDRLHYIKLLRAQGFYLVAASHAAAFYQSLVDQGIVPRLELLQPAAAEKPAGARRQDDPVMPTPPAFDLPQVAYLFADLLLVWANALTWASASEDDERQVEVYCGAVISLLHDPDRFDQMVRQSRAAHPTLARDDNWLRLRRTYLLGQAHHIRSQLLRQRQDYDRAIEDASAGMRAFKVYDEGRISLDECDHALIPRAYLNDNIRDELVVVRHNLALIFAENGTFGWALRISDELIQEYAPKVLPYLQTLIHNNRALIHLRQGDYDRAREALELAEQAVQATTTQRARGLVSWTKAEIDRRRMNHVDRVPQQGIEDLYQQAARRLEQERDNQRDVLHDHARFLRDLAFWYGQAGDRRAQDDFSARAVRLLDDALALLPAGQRAMQRADLLETQVSIYTSLGRYSEAGALLDDIDTIMHAPMPWYAQVVCGKLALQRAYLCLEDPAQPDPQRALHATAIGLARMYAFGRRHRSQASAEGLIRLWIGKRVPIKQLEHFVGLIEHDPFYIRLEELPYQFPTVRRWTAAWDSSVAFFSDFLVERQLGALLDEIKQGQSQPLMAEERTALGERLKKAKAQAQWQIEERIQAGRLPSEPLLQLLHQVQQQYAALKASL